MGRLRHGVPLLVLILLALVCAGCGGTFSSPPPPPPAPDFTLSLSSNSISITQGTLSPALNVTVNPVNAFSGSVQVTFNVLPTGVISNPASPFSVVVGAGTPVIFGASANAATGNFMISVQGTSGNLSHSDPLSVAIQSAVNSALSRSGYARTDSTSSSDDPFGEPRHYGPQVLQLFPNAGVNAGGDAVQIYGYGFGSDPSKITVKIGAANATVQKVENVTSIVSSLGLDTSYPFSLQRITLQTPAGSSGKADVLVSSPSGSTTSAKSFQYLQSVQSHSLAGFLTFLLYDQSRQQIYITNIDHIEVLSLQQIFFYR